MKILLLFLYASLVPDHKNFQRNLRPDFSVQQSAEQGGNLHQVVESEREAGQEKMGQIPKNFCGRVLAFGGEWHLQDRLKEAKTGDYVVVEANKMITVLTLRSITPKTLLLEEISAPLHHLKKRPSSWPEWIQAKAPGHTSWSMVEIDLQNGQILECFSFSRSAWIRLTQKESLLATLLHLPLQNVPPERQRKIGPPPMPGEPDVRKPWVPSLFYEGEKWENPSLDVYETVWPEDGTELSKRPVLLYFGRNKPLPFPLWIQAETSHATIALRAIDAGKNLPIVYPTLPRRVPEFIGLPLKTEKGLRLSLKSPKYYKAFELFAVDITTREKQIFPITHSLIQGQEEEQLTIEIEREELDQALQSDHRYTWLLVPTGHSESYTETSKPFVWIPEKR